MNSFNYIFFRSEKCLLRISFCSVLVGWRFSYIFSHVCIHNTYTRYALYLYTTHRSVIRLILFAIQLVVCVYISFVSRSPHDGYARRCFHALAILFEILRFLALLHAIFAARAKHDEERGCAASAAAWHPRRRGCRSCRFRRQRTKFHKRLACHETRTSASIWSLSSLILSLVLDGQPIINGQVCQSDFCLTIT